jgi:hypothetical protein
LHSAKRVSRFIAVLTQIHFGQSPSVNLDRENRKHRHSASARYTLRAGKWKTQINQAQFRAKTAGPVVVKEGETEAASSRAETPGNAQATVAGAIRENWL